MIHSILSRLALALVLATVIAVAAAPPRAKPSLSEYDRCIAQEFPADRASKLCAEMEDYTDRAELPTRICARTARCTMKSYFGPDSDYVPEPCHMDDDSTLRQLQACASKLQEPARTAYMLCQERIAERCTVIGLTAVHASQQRTEASLERVDEQQQVLIGEVRSANTTVGRFIDAVTTNYSTTVEKFAAVNAKLKKVDETIDTKIHTLQDTIKLVVWSAIGILVSYQLVAFGLARLNAKSRAHAQRYATLQALHEHLWSTDGAGRAHLQQLIADVLAEKQNTVVAAPGFPGVFASAPSLENVAARTRKSTAPRR